MTTRTLASLAVLVLLLNTLAFAQGVATGDLQVTVKDPKGNLVANATVIARDPAKGLERTGTGNGAGEYRILALSPGRYTVTAEAPGFAKFTAENVVVTVGEVADLPVTLSVAGTQEVVNVSAEAELVETQRTSSTDTINQQSIDNLPINGRNYINFALTDSQVVRDNAPSIGAAPTSGLNMSGQRARSNLVNVDGADAIDNSTDGVRSTVSQEAVQEFQIINNSYAAEYGRAAGGVVNIITRSGSNDFHGDVYGYLRNRNFQAVNPFSTTPNPAYTRVQAGVAFGGPIKKDKTYYYFSYEVTRRHETGFASIGADNFDLVPFNTGAFGLGTVLLTQPQIAFVTNPAVLQQEGTVPGFAQEVGSYIGLAGASSGMALNGKWPAGLGGLSGFPTSCPPPTPGCFVPASFQTLESQVGNFPIFEGTSLYSLRLDHNISTSNRLMLRANVSPSTITGIEVNGENQVAGQNSYSRTSQQTYRDVAGVVQDTWTIGANKVNSFLFQYARRGLSYFYSSAPGGGDVAVNIPGFAFFGREPYSYINRVEQRFQFTDNFSWTMGRHDTKFGVDFNYIPITATFTVNYGGEYTFGAQSIPSSLTPIPPPAGTAFPGFNAIQAYGAGIPTDYVQGIGNPNDSFNNKPLGVYWQDSWRARPNLTLNYGVRYDVEFPPQLASPNPLAKAAYNQLGLQKGIQTDTNNVQPRIGVAWDPKGDGKTVIRSSFGIFYDHPLLGLYFLGDASDGSRSGQALLFESLPGCNPPGSPLNLTATNTFQGLAGTCFPAAVSAFGYEPNQQQFNSFLPNSLFINQGYLASGVPLVNQPFGYPQAKNFVYAYSQQANLTLERDLGGGFALSLGYNWNGGRHLNRPINANAVRGDLLIQNWEAALTASPTTTSSNPLAVASCGPSPFAALPGALPYYVPAALTNFFRPSGLNPSLAAVFAPCVPLAQADLQAARLNAACNPATLASCIPFSDMDANYSNGSSNYNGFTTNLRKRFSSHYEFLASYTWSHAIDDSTDLQSPLAPQDSYYPQLERSNSLFDQRHRFVFSGVYQSGRLGGDGFASKFFSNWTFAPIIEFSSGRPYNLTTGSSDNFQFVSSGGRPNVVPSGTPTNACGYATVASSVSPTGFFQEPCFASLTPVQLVAPNALLLLDGNLGRNAGIQPWTVFNDVRVARRIDFGERVKLDLMVDIFNLANRFNVAQVNPLFTNAGQATASYDPRQFQFAMKVNW
jgi:hypothetical protein